MIMVQKYHSIHEIDPEFVPSIELLLQEEVASFATLVHRHESAPKDHTFSYFLFFGPTQNTPIGYAQVCLKHVPSEKFLPWYKRMAFWNKEHKHWKQASWFVADGCSGMCVFDQRFARSGREKLQDLVKEYETRKDIVAHELFNIKGLQDFSLSKDLETKWSKEVYVLEPLAKAFKTYQDYLSSLSPDVQLDVKAAWKELHKNTTIELGDYPSPHETPKTLPIPQEQLEMWEKWGAQVLTFEKDLKVLGCLLVLKGKNGNIFFEPYPFEPHDQALVSDEIYTQYALFKFFDMPEARKCHLMKFGTKLTFVEKEDLKFFQAQGFQLKTVIRSFESGLKELTQPL